MRLTLTTRDVNVAVCDLAPYAKRRESHGARLLLPGIRQDRLLYSLSGLIRPAGQTYALPPQKDRLRRKSQTKKLMSEEVSGEGKGS